MKLALVQCPAFDINKPPIALAYLSSYLKKANHEVCIFDFNIDLFSSINNSKKHFWNFENVHKWFDDVFISDIVSLSLLKKWAKQILAVNPKIIGFSTHHSSLKLSIKLVNILKELSPTITIIFGGQLHQSSDLKHADNLLSLKSESNHNIIDIIVLREGEETIVEIANRIQNDLSFNNCSGTIIKKDNKLINNGLRPFIKSLDSMPFPDFDDFSKIYNKPSFLPILGSRGCTHNCYFCEDTLLWGKYRFRTPKNIVQEMKLREKDGYKFIEFNDLLINANPLILEKLCDLIISKQLNLTWGASARINKFLNKQFLKKMNVAGCRYLNYGIESASPKILKEMNKGFFIEDAKKVLKYTYKSGISVCTNWIVGFPTETEEDFKKTLTFIKSNKKFLKQNIMVNSFFFKNSYLFNNQNDFGIFFNENHAWISQNGANNIQIRKNRYDEIIKLIASFDDLPVHNTFYE